MPRRHSYLSRSYFALSAAVMLAAACTGEIGSETTAPKTEEPPLPEGACQVEGEVQYCYPGDAVTADIGACKTGTSTCVGGEWGECADFVLPEDEICGDDADNNCDGVIDEGCPCEDGSSRPCYTGQAQTRDIGICTDGVNSCVDGVWADTCEGEVLPEAEACDTVDNNCNGLVDDGCNCVDGTTQPCYTGGSGTENVGECHGGQQTCSNGAWSTTCGGEVTPSAENCNGDDDDCDGNTDEGDPGGGSSCSSGQQGVCSAGTRHCQSGGLVCQANLSPSPEQCDGLDNDCDGATDEGNPGGGNNCTTSLPGRCSAGTRQCQGGQLQCVQNLQATSESCNNIDDDCDGQTDEGNPGGGGNCATGNLGVCAQGTTQCQNGNLACNQNSQASTEVCGDMLDNDCDGQTDEGCNPTQHIRDAVNRGWWNDTGSHTSTNDNTLTGWTSGEYRSYFSFSLAGISGTVVSAELRLEIEQYYGTDASENVVVWDVTTNAATLEATGTNIGIYNDLGSGPQYGSFSVLMSQVGQIKIIPLNSNAINRIQSSLGGDFSVGCSVTTLTKMVGAFEAVRFSASSEARVHQLRVYTL